jgi:hypothetical protein
MTQFLTPEEMKTLGVAPDVGPPVVGTPVGAQSPAPPVEGPCLPGWQRITEDTAVCRGPALFYGAILTSDGVGATEAIFYDGVNASGRRLFRLLALTTATLPLFFPVPIPLEDGLYVDVGSNLGDLFLIYAPLPG